jgi:prepilin-type N-terminal cleavage/methylation domain-containing protein
MRTLLRDQRGMTLTELMAAMFISIIIFGAAVTTFVEFLDVSTRSDNQNQAQDTARATIERLSSQLRNATATGSTGATPIESFAGFDFIFLAPLPNATISSATNPRGLYHIRYCLTNLNTKNDILWFQTAPYNSTTQATPPPVTACPDTGWPTRTAVANHVVNRSVAGAPALFTKRMDANGDTTHIVIKPIVDWNPNTKPEATTLLSTVNLRNVNRVPTASVTCQGLASGHAVCDASASSDPDGQTLTYAWTLDGTTLASEKTARLDYSPLASKSTHTIVARVTDPGGATATATRTVTIP